MSTHLPRFQSFSSFIASFCNGQIRHQQHKGYVGNRQLEKVESRKKLIRNVSLWRDLASLLGAPLCPWYEVQPLFLGVNEYFIGYFLESRSARHGKPIATTTWGPESCMMEVFSRNCALLLW